MELTELRYFYEAAKLEHITKAAENLHVAQPALTKQIKLLEDELGVKLFVKSGRNVKLTRYGEFLKNKLAPVLKEIDLLPKTVENLKDMNKNTISICALAASTEITDIIIKYKKKNPDVIFKMDRSEQSMKDDVTVYTGAPHSTGTVTTGNALKTAVMSERIFIAVPCTSEFALRDEISISEIRHCDFITLSGSKRFRPLCDAFCHSAGFTPQVAFESDSLIAVKNLIAAGVGVAFWPEFSWGQISTENIKLLKTVSPECKRDIIITLSADAENPALSEDFYEFMLSEMKKLPESKKNS